MEVRQANAPAAAKAFDTAQLRSEFLIQNLFKPGRINLTYTHIDRFIAGGAMPQGAALMLEALKPIGAPHFLARRELGVFNIGGAGNVTVDGKSYELGARDTLYIGMGAKDVVFESADKNAPAKFYLLSTPAHATYETRLLKFADAKKVPLGSAESSNKRTIVQVIHPDVCKSCQLVMGFTVLEPGNIWNSMPCHTHDRRSEIYLYFDMAESTRVFHFMGEPQETRHLLMANEEAVIAPGWSIHCGAGTAAYTFCWAMAGENQVFTDMDAAPVSDLR